MVLGHRTVARIDSSPENVDAIQTRVMDWLWDEKGMRNIPFDEGLETNAHGDRVRASAHKGFGYRWTLHETVDAPLGYRDTTTSRLARTEVSLLIKDFVLTLWVDVHPPVMKVEGRDVLQKLPVPSFIPDLLTSQPFFDGAGMDRAIRGDQAQNLLNTILDPDRVGAVHVLMTGKHIREEVAEYVFDLMPPFSGTFYTVDEEAAAYLAANDLGVPAPTEAGVRVYRPIDADGFLDVFDINIANLLLEDDDKLRSQLASVERALRDDTTLPEWMQKADRALRREVTHALFASEVEGTDALQQRLADAEAMTVEALDDCAEFQSDLASAHAEINDLRAQSAADYDALSAERLQADLLRGEVDRLRRELIRNGAQQAAYAAGSTTIVEPPASFEELLARVEGSDTVLFCGDYDKAVWLDSQSALGEPVLGRAWDAIVTFDAFVRARRDGEYEGSLRDYVTNASHGLTMRISRAAWQESDTVKKSRTMRAEREVRVPREVSPDGVLMILPHIALATKRANAPRLYFHDAYPAIGQVILGYIGGHLTTASNPSNS